MRCRAVMSLSDHAPHTLPVHGGKRGFRSHDGALLSNPLNAQLKFFTWYLNSHKHDVHTI